jgi:hypothetical protein
VSSAPERCDLPTPETRRKIRRDIVRGLYERGRLHPNQIEAAEEIRMVHEAVGRGMFPTSQVLMRWGRRPVLGASRDFLDRMSETERHAWQHRYLPWTHDLATEIAGGMAGTRWLQLIIDVVVDNAALREVETRYRLRHGAALEYLVAGLDRYADRRR